MRTLKKTLCLVLALVMCLGLCTVAFADNGVDNLSKFSDIANVDHVEAADFLIAAGVVDGFKVGNGFQLQPEGTLTRAEAVKLVTYMMLGAEKADSYKATELKFTDVKSSHWAAGYIQYASNEGIIQGRGNGIFDPEGQVTGLEMAAMLLRCLGYDRTAETALKYPVGVQSKAFSLGLFSDGITSAATNTAINRDKTFQMVFNAMTKIATVQYNASVGAYFTGTSFQQNQDFCVNDSSTWWTTLADSNGNPVGYANTLGYKTANMVPKFDNDDLAYYVREWQSRKSGLAVTNEYDAYNLVATVDARTNAKTLAGRIEDTNGTKPATIWINGGETPASPTTDKAANATVGSSSITTTDVAELAIQAAKNGYKVELIDTNDNGLGDRVIIVVEYIARVTKVTPEKGPDAAKATVTVFDKDGPATAKATVLSDEYFTGVKGFEQGDILTVIPNTTCTLSHLAAPADKDSVPVTLAAAANYTGTEYAVVSVEVATPKYSDVTVTAFDGNDTVDTAHTASVTFGGETYNYSYVEAKGLETPIETNPFVAKDKYKLNGTTYDFYFNSTGYIIGATLHKNVETIPNVLYVTAMESKETYDSLWGTSKSFEAKIRAYDVKGVEKIYDLKLERAKEDGEVTADYLLTEKGLADASSVIAGDTSNTVLGDASDLDIAKGEQYIEIGESSAEGNEVVIKLMNMNTWASDWAKSINDSDGAADVDAINPVLAFTEDNDGNVTLSLLPKKANGVTYNGGVVDATMKVVNGSADVTADSTTRLYATTNTNLVVVNGEKKVTTDVTGYANFPGGPQGTTYTVGSSRGEVKAVFYVTSKYDNDPKTTVTNIVVIGADEQPETANVLLAYANDWQKTTNAKGEEIILRKFVNAATGDTVWYEVNGTPTLAPDKAFTGVVQDGKVTLTDATEFAVVQVQNTWIKVVPVSQVNGTTGKYDEAKAVVLYMPAGFTAYNLGDGGPDGYAAANFSTTLTFNNAGTEKDVQEYIYLTVKKAPADWTDVTNPNPDDLTLTAAFIAKAADKAVATPN